MVSVSRRGKVQNKYLRMCRWPRCPSCHRLLLSCCITFASAHSSRWLTPSPPPPVFAPSFCSTSLLVMTFLTSYIPPLPVAGNRRYRSLIVSRFSVLLLLRGVVWLLFYESVGQWRSGLGLRAVAPLCWDAVLQPEVSPYRAVKVLPLGPHLRGSNAIKQVW